jgi:hypothetical protein
MESNIDIQWAGVEVDLCLPNILPASDLGHSQDVSILMAASNGWGMESAMALAGGRLPGDHQREGAPTLWSPSQRVLSALVLESLRVAFR